MHNQQTLVLLGIALLSVLIFMMLWNRHPSEHFSGLNKKCTERIRGLCHGACIQKRGNINECYFCETGDPAELFPLTLGSLPESVQEHIRDEGVVNYLKGKC
jgi:hypothetical protein